MLTTSDCFAQNNRNNDSEAHYRRYVNNCMISFYIPEKAIQKETKK